MEIQYLTYPLNGLLMIALPIVLGIYLNQRFHLGWKLWLIGAAAFTLSQVGHIPFNLGLTTLFRQGILPSPPQAWALIFNAVILGLSAGLFEETARYVTYRWFAKDARSWARALVLGAGHGGIEAIILGFLFFFTFLQMIALRGADLSALIPAEQLNLAEQQVNAFWTAPWYMTILGGVERLFTLPQHIFMSVLVLQVFTRRQIRWLFASIGWHAALNALAILSASAWGALAAEAVIGILAVIATGFIFVLRQPEPKVETEGLPPLPEPGPVQQVEILESSENLDSSRYSH